MELAENDKVQAGIEFIRKKAEAGETEQLMQQVMKSQLPNSIQLLQYVIYVFCCKFQMIYSISNI